MKLRCKPTRLISQFSKRFRIRRDLYPHRPSKEHPLEVFSSKPDFLGSSKLLLCRIDDPQPFLCKLLVSLRFCLPKSLVVNPLHESLQLFKQRFCLRLKPFDGSREVSNLMRDASPVGFPPPSNFRELLERDTLRILFLRHIPS